MQRSFPQVPESVQAARRFMLEALANVPHEVVDRATLIVSELATNAVQHAQTGFVINVERTDSEISVEVLDSGVGEPTVRTASRDEASGRGLKIVDVLADEWGVRPTPTAPGKIVWFKLSLAEVSAPVN